MRLCWPLLPMSPSIPPLSPPPLLHRHLCRCPYDSTAISPSRFCFDQELNLYVKCICVARFALDFIATDVAVSTPSFAACFSLRCAAAFLLSCRSLRMSLGCHSANFCLIHVCLLALLFCVPARHPVLPCKCVVSMSIVKRRKWSWRFSSPLFCVQPSFPQNFLTDPRFFTATKSFIRSCCYGVALNFISFTAFTIFTDVFGQQPPNLPLHTITHSRTDMIHVPILNSNVKDTSIQRIQAHG